MRNTMPRKPTGFSLVELMVAMTIGLLLLLGLVSVVSNSSTMYGELNKTAQQVEGGRYAIEILKEDIQHAGFYGPFYDPNAAIPGTLPDPCATAIATLSASTVLPVQGYNNHTSGLSSCISDADHLDGTDILVIRRVQTTPTPAASLVAQDVYLQADGGTPTGGARIFGTGGTTFDRTWYQWNGATQTTVTAPIYKYVVHIYFVSPCSIPTGANCASGSDNGSPIPTLKRLELVVSGGALGWTTVPLVEGVENLQIDYGLDTDGDGTVDGAYTAAPANTTAWSNVVSMRLNLLVRNIEPSAGYTDAKTYNLGLHGTVTPGGHYRRRVYSSVVQAVNVIGRRQ